MKQNSKKILLWGIKIISERYFNQKLDLEANQMSEIRSLLKKTLSLISDSSEFINDFIEREDYIEKTDELFALKSIFTQVGFCSRPHLGSKVYIRPKIGLNEFVDHSEEKSFTKEELSADSPDELLKCNESSSSEKLINLLFKYGANFPIFNEENCSLPLYDFVKILAALATNPEGDFRLVIGDLSGIQNFVYTIASEKALKVLRARSFYLELLTKSLAYEICDNLNLTSANILYSGGGNFLLLLPEIKGLEDKLDQYYQSVNTFFLKNFEGNLHIPLTSVKIKNDELKNVKDKWAELYGQELEKAKKQKFIGLLSGYDKPRNVLPDECEFCHIDDAESTKISNKQCEMCSKFEEYGNRLRELNYITGTLSNDANKGIIIPSIQEDKVWHFDLKNTYKDRRIQVNSFHDIESILMFYSDQVVTKKDEHGQDITADFIDIVKYTVGSDMIATLVMDVDNMGAIFKEAIKLGNKHLNEAEYLILAPVLSRNLDFFFKFNLNNICKNPQTYSCENSRDFTSHKIKNKYERKVSVIYSGGDDLLLTGAWNDVVEVAFDIQKQFKAFSCDNSDIGISGGIYLSQPKFPFYISVQKALEAEKKAKSNIIDVANGEWQERDYKDTSILVRSRDNGKIRERLKIKNSIYIFYDEIFDYQINLMDENDHKKQRFARAVKWEEVWDRVLPQLNKFLSTNLSRYDNVDENIKFEFPRSFITKLYDMVNKYRTMDEGILYLPDLVYHYSRFDSSMRHMLKPIFETYNRYDLKSNHNSIYYLPIILNWIELLMRTKGEK